MFILRFLPGCLRTPCFSFSASSSLSLSSPSFSTCLSQRCCVYLTSGLSSSSMSFISSSASSSMPGIRGDRGTSVIWTEGANAVRLMFSITWWRILSRYSGEFALSMFEGRTSSWKSGAKYCNIVNHDRSRSNPFRIYTYVEVVVIRKLGPQLRAHELASLERPCACDVAHGVATSAQH